MIKLKIILRLSCVATKIKCHNKIPITFREAGIEAEYLASNKSISKDSILNLLETNKLKILYITPEMYQNSDQFIDKIKQCEIIN